MRVKHTSPRFSLAPGGREDWEPIYVGRDLRFLTDQAEGEQFTDTFIGVCAHDVSGRRA